MIREQFPDGWTAPSDWTVMPLSDAVEQIDYGLSAPIPKTVPESGVPIVSTADITKSGRILYGKIRRISAPDKTVARLTLREGDLLFNWRNSAELIGKTGVFTEQSEPHIFASFILRIRCDETKTHSLFLAYLINYYREAGIFVNLARRAVNQANYNRNEISVLKIPRPPYDEQRKIAAVLGLVRLAIEQQEQLIALTTELKKALLHKLFTEGLRGEPQKQTEIGPVPESWEVSKLADLFEIKHGYAFDGAFFKPDGKYILLTPGHFFEEGGFRDQKDKTKYYVGEIPRGYLLVKGDLLVAMTEQKAGLLGSTIIIPENEKYLHNQRLGLIQNLYEQRLDKLFLFYFFNTAGVRKQIFLTSSGSKVRHTSPGKIRELSMAVPSLEEQKDIAQLLQAVDAKLQVNERKRQSITDLFHTLLHQLMTAQIRVNDLDVDEILPQPVAEIGDRVALRAGALVKERQVVHN